MIQISIKGIKLGEVVKLRVWKRASGGGPKRASGGRGGRACERAMEIVLERQFWFEIEA